MSVGTTEAMEPVPAPMPLFKRIVGTFTSPRSVFESLRAHPRWLDVLLIGIILGVVLYVPMSPIVEKMSLDKAVERLEKVQGMTAEQRERAIEGQRAFFQGPAFKALSIGGALVGPVVVLLFYALLFLLGYGFLFGGQLKFVQAFSAACHLNLIFTLAGLIKAPLILARKSMEVATSLALVLPDADSSSVIYGVLDMFDVFTLWGLFAMITGMAVMARVSTAKSRLFGVILFLVIMGIRVLGAMLGQMGQAG
jgi:hypothetical protein